MLHGEENVITYGSIYLIVRDFEGALAFYRALFQREVSAQNKNRFAVFQLDGLTLCLMNGQFDAQHPEQVVHKGAYYQEYDDMCAIARAGNPGKVVINLTTDDLRREHQRIARLNLGNDLTKVRYINAREPYYYFSMKDLDGNTIEITGPYQPERGEGL